MSSNDSYDLREQVACLRSDVNHIQADITDIKSELRGIHQKFDDVNQRIDKLKDSLHASRIWALGLYVSTLFILAKGFKWL